MPGIPRDATGAVCACADKGPGCTGRQIQRGGSSAYPPPSRKAITPATTMPVPSARCWPNFSFNRHVPNSAASGAPAGQKR